MRIFAIGDLHLSFEETVDIDNWEKVKEYKSMSIFGENWNKHYRKIYDNWIKNIKEDDLVLIPGDISWATTMEEIEPDIKFIDMLPGKKLLIRGNHDYWWKSIGKMRSRFPENTYLLQNDSKRFGEITIAGSRGWIVPNSYEFTEHDEKIYKRELIRLEMSLKSIKKNKIQMNKGKNDKTIVMMHYMPVNEKHEYNSLIELLKQYSVDICLYGHLHGIDAHKKCLQGKKWGIDFRLVSSDYLNFRPVKIL